MPDVTTTYGVNVERDSGQTYTTGPRQVSLGFHDGRRHGGGLEIDVPCWRDLLTERRGG